MVKCCSLALAAYQRKETEFAHFRSLNLFRRILRTPLVANAKSIARNTANAQHRPFRQVVPSAQAWAAASCSVESFGRAKEVGARQMQCRAFGRSPSCEGRPLLGSPNLWAGPRWCAQKLVNAQMVWAAKLWEAKLGGAKMGWGPKVVAPTRCPSPISPCPKCTLYFVHYKL